MKVKTEGRGVQLGTWLGSLWPKLAVALALVCGLMVSPHAALAAGDAPYNPGIKIDRTVKEDTQHPGQITIKIAALLTWDDDAPPSVYRIKHNGVIKTEELDGSAREYEIHYVEKNEAEGFEETEDFPYWLEGFETAFFAKAWAESEIGTWRVEEVCGGDGDEADYDPPLLGGGGDAPPLTTPEIVEPPWRGDDHQRFDPKYETVLYTRTLFTHASRGMDIEFTIQYCSDRVSTDGPLSYGWTHSYNMYLEKVNPGVQQYPYNYVIHMGLQAERFLKFSGSSVYYCFNPYVELKDIDNGDKLRVRIKGVEYVFNWSTLKAESMTIIKERAYNSEDERVDNDGHTMTFAYYDAPEETWDGELESITDPSGRIYTFTYWEEDGDDGLEGKLRYVDHPNSSQPELVEFSYDNDNDNDNLEEVEDAEGQTTTFTYYDPGEQNVFRKHALAKVAPSAGVNTYFFHKCLYEFDDPTTEDEDVVPVISYTDKTHGTIDNNPLQNNPYGKVNVKKTIELVWNGNRGVDEVICTYREVTDAEGWTSKYEYGDKKGPRKGYPLLEETDGEGYVTRYTYDKYENVTRKVVTNDTDYWLITLNKYYVSEPEDATWENVCSTITRKIDFDPEESYLTYDSYYEYLEYQLGPGQNPDWTYTYDGQGWGRRLSSTDSADVETYTRYKEDGGYTWGLVAETGIKASDQTVSQKVTYDYVEGEQDPDRWLLETKTEERAETDLVTEYSYYDTGDYNRGMLEEVLVTEGSLGPTLTDTVYAYNETNLGVPTSIEETGQNGRRTTTFTYDKLNRVTRKELPPAAGSGDRYKTEWTYHWYDDVADVVKSYGSDGSGWDEIEKTRKVYSTDSGWLKTEWVYLDPEAEDPDAEVDLKTSYTYYDNGMLDTVMAPEGQTDGSHENARTKYEYFENQLKKKILYYKDASNYDEESFTYFPDGQIESSTNCRDNTTDYEYDECNRQSKVTDPLGGETDYEYDAATTRVTSVTNPEGEETESTYDKFGRLDDETIVMTGDDIVTEYEYDTATGQLVKVTQVMDPLNPNEDIVTEYEYDVQGRQTKITYASGSDEETWVEYTYTDPGSVETETRFVEAGSPDTCIVTEYAYDELDRKTSVTTVMTGDDIVTEYAYDEFVFDTSDPFVLRTDTVTDPRGNEIDSTYDVFGRLVEVRHLMDEGTEDDIVTAYEYDKNGKTIEETDAVGTVTEFEYDSRDRLVKTTFAVGTALECDVQLTLDANGNVVTSTDQLDNETDFTYDELDRLVKTTYADDTTLELTRDDMGRVTEYTDQEGRITTFLYDDAGRLVKTTGPDGESVELTLDAMGNVTTRKDQELNETDYAYDDLGRLELTTYEDSTTVQRTYDGVGNLTTLTDQRSNTTTYYYDDAGRLVKTVYPDTKYEELTLDGLGNVTVRTDRNGSETSYAYDELGRVETIQYPSGGDTITNTYDAMSRVLTVTVEDAGENQLSKVTRDYDELGRLEEETQELATAGTGKTVVCEYDDAGNRTDIDYPGGMGLTLEYDDVYRLTAVEDDEDPTPAIAAYTYNDAGEVTRLDLKNGAYTEYAYDEVGRLETLVNTSPGNWVISSCGYARNKVGCPTRLTYQDGRYRDYAYDDLYRLTREEHVDPWDTTIAWHGYAYDAAGNREEKEYDAAESGNKYTYSNNNMNQLTTLTASGTPGHKTDVAGMVTDENVASVTVVNDTLDPVGEFEAALRQTFFIARGVELETDDNDLYAVALDKTGSETRDPATGYHVVTLDDPPDPSLTYVYDDNGCLVEIKEGATTLKEYLYDYENRLVEVKHGGTPVAAFEYDGLGRRIKSTVGSVVTRFVYDGDAVLEEYAWDTQSSSWVLAAVYVHGIGVDNAISIERGGEIYYYHYDGYGSVSELTDEDGALAQAYEYDAWGNATIYDPESAIENPYLYTGRRWDAAIALYYYRARHYAPTLGRFLQPDPIGYGDGTNLYIYVSGTPTVFIDPTGLFDIPDWLDPLGVEDDINKGLERIESVERAVGKAVRNLPDSIPDEAYRTIAWGCKLAGKALPGLVPGSFRLQPVATTVTDPRVAGVSEPTPGEVAEVKATARRMWDLAITAADSVRRGANIPLLSESLHAAGGMVENYATDLDNAVTMTERHGHADGFYYLMGTWVTGTQHIADALAQWDTAREEPLTFPEAVDRGTRGGLQAFGCIFAGQQLGRGLAASGRLPGWLSRPIGFRPPVLEAPPLQIAPATGDTATLPEGSFSIRDWSTYPKGGVPKPRGPFRTLEGLEHRSARRAADAANRAMHEADPGLSGLQIHEIQPVKFGGSAVDPANKAALTATEHARYTSWWNRLMRSMYGRHR